MFCLSNSIEYFFTFITGGSGHSLVGGSQPLRLAGSGSGSESGGGGSVTAASSATDGGFGAAMAGRTQQTAAVGKLIFKKCLLDKCVLSTHFVQVLFFFLLINFAGEIL